MKKIPFARPKRPENGEAWVSGEVGAQQAAPIEKMKRLTIDIPDSIHHAVKVECAMRRILIADLVRSMLSEWVAEATKKRAGVDPSSG